MFFEVAVRNEGNEKNPKKKERKNSKAHQLPPRLPERRPHHGLRQTPRVLLDQRQQVVGDPGPAGGRGAARAPPLLVLRRGCWLRRRCWCRCRPVADERDVRPRLVEGRGGLCVRGLPLEESQPGVDGVEEAAEGRPAEGRGRGRRWNRGIIIGHRRRQRGVSRCRSCCCWCGCCSTVRRPAARCSSARRRPTAPSDRSTPRNSPLPYRSPIDCSPHARHSLATHALSHSLTSLRCCLWTSPSVLISCKSPQIE